MFGNEALSIPAPRNAAKKRKSIKKSFNRYFIAICALFTVVLVLCINSIVVYKSYAGIHGQFSDMLQKVKSISTDNRNLSIEKENLRKENTQFKEEYNKIISKDEEILKQIEELKAMNEGLMKKNKELLDDNVALQNSLKMAASAGIKPQNFTKFDGLTSRGDLERGAYVGKFLGTAYTPSKDECGNNGGITNSGKPIIPGISVAIDNKQWPFGTVFYIKGLGYAVAMDTGSAIKGKFRFDFAVLDKKFAQTLGSRYWDVYLVKLGNGSVESVKF